MSLDNTGLREHLVKGFAMNDDLLKQKRLERRKEGAAQ